MPNVKATKLLTEALSDAVLSDGLIDTDSIKFEPLREIIDKSLYDSAIDWSFFWNIFITSTLYIHDYEKQTRKLTQTEIEGVVNKVDSLASSVPHKYVFYYKLPENYPSGTQDLDVISIVKVNKKLSNLIENMNPVKGGGLAEVIGKLHFGQNLPKLGEIYIRIEDQGLVRSSEFAYLESNYSPDRLVGLFYALHVIFRTARTDSIRRHQPTPLVFDSAHQYVANFKNPLKYAQAATISFTDDATSINAVNALFTELSTIQENQINEAARIQLCNALFWYFEFLNNDEWSLQLVFLVSVIDSLFPTRRSKVINRTIVPTVSEKAPLIAAVVSENEAEKDKQIFTIEKLFNSRNDVIHGKLEIHGYSKATSKDKAQYKELIQSSEEIIREYLISRVKRYLAS